VFKINVVQSQQFLKDRTTEMEILKLKKVNPNESKELSRINSGMELQEFRHHLLIVWGEEE
jgi:hypothetical protein